MPDRDLITEGRQRLAAAAPGPFQIASREGIFTDLHSLHRLLPGKDGYREVVARGVRIPDAELFVFMANRFGPLLDELEHARTAIAKASTEIGVASERVAQAHAVVVSAHARITELEAIVEAVRTALAAHPRCDVHPAGDPVTCGWKLAVADVQRALDATEVNDRG
ncbi:hypothetical protein [Nocardia sp. NPDC004860]|uniref:hypothetical protein n=1 Tax=Nocardia sp. NPDC004860 TaxID=3154557 RepID=UPI0033AA0986